MVRMAMFGSTLPPQIRGQSRLTPYRGSPVTALERPRLAVTDVDQRSRNRLEVFRHRPVLNDGVRFDALVEFTGRAQVDRAGVDAFIHSQQRGANVLEVSIRERPETAV